MRFLGPGQKPLVMTHYPHMMEEDITVWSKFLSKMGKVIERVYYDVHVGKPVEFVEEPSPIELKVAAGVTRKRIDAVCIVGQECWVIEVKPYANMLALGQAYAYAKLFEQEFSVPQIIRAVVVCDNVDEDVVASFRDLGVMVFVNEKS